MNNILCVGGAGFIGSHLADRLIQLGHQVIILDNLSTGNIRNIKNHNLVVRDLNENLDDIFSKYKFDYVFHLAAFVNLRESIINPIKCAKDNIIGSINLINYCNKYNIKKIIFSSTGGAMYSPDETMPWEEGDKELPNSPYGLSKLYVEKYLNINNQLHGLPYNSLRYANVYGPRQNVLGEAGVISIFIEKMLKNQNITIYGNGDQSRDFIYVDDVVSANIAMMESTKNIIYNVSSGDSYSLNEIIEILSDKLYFTGKIIYEEPINGEVFQTQLNNYLLMTDANWKPEVNLSKGIDQTINYFKTQGHS